MRSRRKRLLHGKWKFSLFFCSVFVDLGSFQVFGIATDLNQSEFSNESRPVLAKPSSSNSANIQKLLQVEFETNPIDKKSDYRVKVLTQSLEIKYNAVKISSPPKLKERLMSFSSQPSIN